MTIDDGAVVNVEADAFGEGDALAVAAQADEVVGRVEMLHAVDFLLDDGTGVEIGGDIVAGGSDQFHAAGVGLLVRVRADESGQEAVVDVDDSAVELLAELLRQDLHETGEDDEFDFLFDDEFADAGETGFFIVAIHRDFIEGDPSALGGGAAVGAVADDGRDLDRQFVEFGAPEDFVEAVVGLGDEHGGPHAVGQAAKMPCCLERATEGAEAVDEVLDIDVEARGFHFEAGEKLAGELVGELGELDEVAMVAGDIARHFGDDAGLVVAAEFEDQSGT